VNNLNPNLLLAFCNLVETHLGISLDLSKEYLVRARLDSLAKEKGFVDYDKFVQMLISTPIEAIHHKAFEALTTNETFFFRDNYPFETIRDTLLPALIQSRQATKRLNIWCAGASTGQEPYSISMILEDFESQISGWRVNILATDISATVLAVARKGLYSFSDIHRGLKPEQIARFFTRTPEGNYQLSKKIMSRVEFRTLNLISTWNLQTQFDLILIRNVLIYFNRQNRDLVLKRMHQQLLDEKSFLMLGSSELIFSDTQFKVFRAHRGTVFQKSQF
jgi:chemotaxis protein methyltransferase CheR